MQVEEAKVAEPEFESEIAARNIERYRSSCREVKALEEEIADIVIFDRRLRDLDLTRAPPVEVKKNLGVEDGD